MKIIIKLKSRNKLWIIRNKISVRKLIKKINKKMKTKKKKKNKQQLIKNKLMLNMFSMRMMDLMLVFLNEI